MKRLTFIVLCMILVACCDLPAEPKQNRAALVPELPPTAKIIDSTTINITKTDVELQVVQFDSGIICVAGMPKHSNDLVLSCDFSNHHSEGVDSK